MNVMELAVFAMAAASLADIVTTERALRRPGTREANGLIARAMARLGRGWIAAKLGLVGAATWAMWAAGWWWAILAVAAATGVVAWRNTRVGR